eukprot:TRINITY_DN8198_c0_g1_i1.p1 TRINITY_DN8198_c0_g1~~TRINITY_DN8198_c0_g1_i1.p1  ORF type:complete len:590 (-),score=87.34 TRINITY_DN8198_c0_g1_i1:276-2045(-)
MNYTSLPPDVTPSSLPQPLTSMPPPPPPLLIERHNVLLPKVVAVVSSFVLAVVCGFLPLWIASYPRAMSILYVFSGGVMIAAGLVHLLPDAVEDLDPIANRIEFPLAFFLAAAGFVVTLIAEQVAIALSGGHGHSHEVPTSEAAPHGVLISGVGVDTHPTVRQSTVAARTADGPGQRATYGGMGSNLGSDRMPSFGRHGAVSVFDLRNLADTTAAVPPLMPVLREGAVVTRLRASSVATLRHQTGHPPGGSRPRSAVYGLVASVGVLPAGTRAAHRLPHPLHTDEFSVSRTTSFTRPVLTGGATADRISLADGHDGEGDPRLGPASGAADDLASASTHGLGGSSDTSERAPLLGTSVHSPGVDPHACVHAPRTGLPPTASLLQVGSKVYLPDGMAVVSPDAAASLAASEADACHHHSMMDACGSDSDESEVAAGGGASVVGSILLLIALSFHSVMEGLALGFQQDEDALWSLLAAVLSHKGLAAFALGTSTVMSMPVAAHRTRRDIWRVVFTVIGWAAESPVATILSMFLFRDVDAAVSGAVQAVAAGTFLYVGILEVLAKELVGPDRAAKVAALLLGFGAMSALARWV